ncbi:MAG TPA: S-methyl-5'-thioadenosine phosphorylase [Thermoanaerobaculia bacterium]|nr:S-methyl-5'-thioadenosine phosphorylase [Thermoanaerobaculia bacterium]
MSEHRIGVIGGSGLYRMDGLVVRETRTVETPFGAPSDPFVLGEIGGRPVAFLARHGTGHRLMPTEINHRANIFGFKLLGVERLISLSAVGSMKERYRPTHIVVVDQFIDRTRHRADTFFGDGLVAHVSLADPVCPELVGLYAAAAREAGAVAHQGGTYLCMEGPQFSTRAESRLYRSWGVDVIGMTNLTEARLAREAEICYATLALVTDYDCWHEEEADVSVSSVLAALEQNARTAQAVVARIVERLPASSPAGCPCANALEHALITQRDRIPADALARLRPLVGRYLGP